MSNTQLLATIRNQDEEIRRLRNELQNRNSVNYEEKYKKALRSIQQIIRANKQIKDQLDSLRMMRQADLQNFSNAQKDEFRKAYDNLLKEKNGLTLSLQSLELQNEKLKYTISELQNQVSLYKNQKFHKVTEERETLQSNQQPEGINTGQNSPRKSDTRDLSNVLREKQAEFHRTLENYQEHHSNLTRTNKRLEQRIGELQSKLLNTEKNWRSKLQAKQMEIIDIKALTRQQFTDQITVLRKENGSLRISNNDLSLKIQSMQKNNIVNSAQLSYDWEAQIVQEMIAVKGNLEPLRQQISELQQMNFYEKEQSIRERTNLQTRVLQLQSEVDRQQQTIKNMQKKVLEAHQEKISLEDKNQNLKRLEEQNQLLNGKVIVMESRQIALKNRTGEELQERILQFENRIDLLLSNKEGLKQLKQIGIHQLLALKAYIMELDSKLKELMNSNSHLLKKYKSYKERYQASLKEQKQLGMTINTFKMKTMGYDKLILKLQGELERMIKINQEQIIQVNRPVQIDGKSQIYRRKYQLMKEKLEIQQKYKEQEMETLKLNYQTKIMELSIKVEELRSLKQTIELYRNKNQELQTVISRKEGELFESKMLTGSKVLNGQFEQNLTNTRQTKDIINNLHLSLKQNDQTIFKLQSELRTKEDTYKRAITRLERQKTDLNEDHTRQLGKKQIDHSLALDQQAKKYRNKINDLEHSLHLLQLNQKDESSKRSQDVESKLRKIEQRAQQAEVKRDEQVFNRRRIQKQILDLTHDKDELQRLNGDLQLKLTQTKTLQRQNQQLRTKLSSGTQQQMRGGFIDYQLQGKDNIIRKLNNQISQLRQSAGSVSEKDITISSQRNQIFYLKKQIEELNDTINKYNNEIVFLKSSLDGNKASYNTGFEGIVEEKDLLIAKLRKDVSGKQFRIHEIQQEYSKIEQNNRRLKRDLGEIDHLRDQVERLTGLVNEKSSLADKLRYESSNHDDQIEEFKRQLGFFKQNFQKLNYDLLQKEDTISKLNLQISNINIRNREQFQSKATQELMEKQRAISKLNSQLMSLKSTHSMVEDDRNYHQQNFKRTNNDLFNLKAQLNQMEEQNSSLREQVYYKTQELTKIQFASEGYRQQIEEYGQKDQQIYKMRSQIYTLRNQISALQDQIYTKEANSGRVVKQLNYVRDQFGDLEEDLKLKQDIIAKLTFEINSIRSGSDETVNSIQQKDIIISKLNSDLGNIKNKYRELEEQMQERQNAFGQVNQQLIKIKSNFSYYQDDIDQKNTQIARFTNERQILRAQIERLSEQITQKNLQLNRSKQQVFSIRMEAGERDYQQKMRIDQQLYAYKNQIGQLQHQLQDKDAQLRRAFIQLQHSRYQPAAAPVISEEQVQQLRNQAAKKQRELINIRFDLEDKQYQIDSAANTINLLKGSINQYQERLQTERIQFDNAWRDRGQKQRVLQDQINRLNEELETKPTFAPQPAASFSISYTEDQMAEMHRLLAEKQRELNAIRYEFQEKLQVTTDIENKVRIQQTLIKQLELQIEQDRSIANAQIQKYATRDREMQQQFQQMQYQFEQQLFQLQQQAQTQGITINQTSVAPIDYDHQLLIKTYIQEIDRLNLLVKQLQEDIEAFKLKLSSMINQQNRIEQNLVTMVLLFSEVESLRDRIKNKESEINQVRKSFIQMTVAGELEPNKMSRIMALAKNNNYSQEQIDDLESNQRPDQKQKLKPFEQINEVHQNLQNSKQDQKQIAQNQQTSAAVVAPPVEPVQSQQPEIAAVPTAVQQVVRVETKQVEMNKQIQGRDSFIMQLQKEQPGMNDSQVATRGQITIKIQNPSQLISQSSTSSQKIVNLPPNYPQQNIRIIQQQPQLIQQGQIIQMQPQLIQQPSQIINQQGQVISQGQVINQQGQVMQQQGQVLQQRVRVSQQQGYQMANPQNVMIQQPGNIIRQQVVMGVAPTSPNNQYRPY